MTDGTTTSGSAPAGARAVLEARARALAADGSTETAAVAHVEVVAFELGDERYAIPTAAVREVVPFVEYVPVPGTPPFVVGLTSLRGELLAAFDLRRFFNVPAQDFSDLTRLIVLGDDGPEFGVLADRVDSVTRIAETDLREPPAGTAGAGRAYVRGVTADGLILLDGRALLATDALTPGNADEGSG